LRKIIRRDVFGGMTSSLDDALNETLGVIQRALDHIRAGDGAEAELRNVHACLLNILELVERDPGIEAASDDLYAAAKELALGVDRGTRMARLLNDSLLRFRERLATARLREAANPHALEPAPIAGTQITQARELLGWPQSYLALRAKLSTAAIERAEAEGGKDAMTVEQWQAILHVLDRAGLEFTRGGVRRKPTAPDRAM
jgi:hypothetical protein